MCAMSLLLGEGNGTSSSYATRQGWLCRGAYLLVRKSSIPSWARVSLETRQASIMLTDYSKVLA